MYNYIVRVRGTTYVWGSGTLTVALAWPLLLVINNDLLGDPIDLGSDTTGPGPTSYGTLQPGECWTLPLQGLRGVFASCTTDTTLACSILVPQLRPA
jgi:hypothetical protein